MKKRIFHLRKKKFSKISIFDQKFRYQMETILNIKLKEHFITFEWMTYSKKIKEFTPSGNFNKRLTLHKSLTR